MGHFEVKLCSWFRLGLACKEGDPLNGTSLRVATYGYNLRLSVRLLILIKQVATQCCYGAPVPLFFVNGMQWYCTITIHQPRLTGYTLRLVRFDFSFAICNLSFLSTANHLVAI